MGYQLLACVTPHTKKGHYQKIAFWERYVLSFESVLFFFFLIWRARGNFSTSIWLWNTVAVFGWIICAHQRHTYNDWKKIYKIYNFRNFLICWENIFFPHFKRNNRLGDGFAGFCFDFYAKIKKKWKKKFWAFLRIFNFLPLRKSH